MHRAISLILLLVPILPCFGGEALKDLVLDLTKDNIAHIAKDYHITVKEIVFEEIAENPDDSDSYPSGTGVEVLFVVSNKIESQEFALSLLPKPYNCVQSIEWGNYRITLKEVLNRQSSQVKVTIRKLE